MARRICKPSCRKGSVWFPDHLVKRAVAVEVHVDGLPELVGDVVEHGEGSVYFVPVGRVESNCHW